MCDKQQDIVVKAKSESLEARSVGRFYVAGSRMPLPI